MRSAYFIFTAASYLLISQIQNRKKHPNCYTVFLLSDTVLPDKDHVCRNKDRFNKQKKISLPDKKESVYQTSSGKYFVSVLRRIDSVIGFTSTSLAPAFIAFSLSELKA